MRKSLVDTFAWKLFSWWSRVKVKDSRNRNRNLEHNPINNNPSKKLTNLWTVDQLYYLNHTNIRIRKLQNQKSHNLKLTIAKLTITCQWPRVRTTSCLLKYELTLLLPWFILPLVCSRLPFKWSDFFEFSNLIKSKLILNTNK